MFENVFDDQVFVTYTCPLLWWIFSIVVVILEQFVQIKAPYGRYNVENTGIPVRVAWFIQELPSFAVPFYLVYYHWSAITTTKLVIISFFLIHYFQRVFIFPLLIRGGKRSSYMTTVMAFIFCLMNSYMIAQEMLAYHTYPDHYFFTARFLIGTTMFFTGLFLNLQADSILRNLRKNDQDKGYKIPRGGLFEYVSGANFFAECIEWTGYAICAWTVPTLAFAAFTWANIGFGRALHHHQFYLEKFENYPKNRKAIIPFIL